MKVYNKCNVERFCFDNFNMCCPNEKTKNIILKDTNQIYINFILKPFGI